MEKKMNQMSFVCDAIYRGSEIVEGAVSPNKLTSLADILLNADQSAKGYVQICIDKLPRGERCQLQIDEERLRVSTSRKDEGFESDSESSSTASGSVIEEALSTSPEIKVIEDHVLRLEKLIRQDSGIHHCNSKSPSGGGSPSMSSSSGAESEEESPRKHDSSVTSSTPPKKDSTSSTGSRTSIQSGGGNGDSILLSDILFCHVMTNIPKVVIVVVKSIDSPLIAAHLFECLTQEAARTLYNYYYSASNKYKLNRYRKSKRRAEGLGPGENSLLDKIHVSIRNIRKTFPESPQNREQVPTFGNNRLLNRSIKNSNNSHSSNMSNYNINGDNTNVNVIEIKDSVPVKVPAGMMQRTDMNGVTHIEIESAPCSLINPFHRNSNNNAMTSFDSQEILSALDRLSLHSSSNPDSYLNSVGVTSSCPNSLIVTSREIHSHGEKERRMRQRQPPLLLKKENFRNSDSLSRNEIRKRDERRIRSLSEERKANEAENLLQNHEETKLSAENLLMVNENNLQNKQWSSQGGDFHSSGDQEVRHNDRQSRLRNPPKQKEERSRPRSNHNKGPAPPPPKNQSNNPSVILVPTKSGQEKSRSYYPKETHIVRGSKLVRIDYPVYPPWNINNDMNNNAKRMYYAHPGWISSHEYHTSRHSDRGMLSADMRKRSRSKSPARRPMAHRYIDVVSTFNFSQKLKDLSDTVIQSWKSNTQNTIAGTPFIGGKEFGDKAVGKRDKKLSNDSSKCKDSLRPVIKRGKKMESDPRRVTFSAYATVQVMET